MFEKVRVYVKCIYFVYILKYGSWFNIVENEFSVMIRQCFKNW